MKTLLDRQLLAGQSLTAREGQVLQLLFRHLTNKEIAHQLNICERTAKFHVSNVLRKFGIENRSEEHTSELQSRLHLVCRLLLEKKKTSDRQPVQIDFNSYRLIQIYSTHMFHVL